MKNWNLPAVCAAACCLAGNAVAAPEINIRELSQSEATYNAAEAALSRQLRLATLNAQIAEKEKAMTQGDAIDLMALPAPAPAPAGSPVVAGASLTTVDLPASKPREPEFPFRLTDLWGTQADGYQAYVTHQGMRQYVRVGEYLPGGWRVLGITRAGLRVQRGSVTKMVVLGG